MAKGHRKRKAAGCFFKPGNKYGGKVSTCITSEPEAGSSVSVSASESDTAQSGCTATSSGAEKEFGKYNLRSGNLKVKADSKDNRVINMQKLLDIINVLSKEHSKSECKDVNIQFGEEVKFGLGSKLTFKCKNCSFSSETLKTYNEIPGTRKAKINTNLVSAIIDTHIGISRTKVLFTQLDIPFPAESHLYTLKLEESSKIVALNKDDMTQTKEPRYGYFCGVTPEPS